MASRPRRAKSAIDQDAKIKAEMRLYALELAVTEALALFHRLAGHSTATVEEMQTRALEGLAVRTFPQLTPEWSDHHIAELEAATARLYAMTLLRLAGS